MLMTLSTKIKDYAFFTAILLFSFSFSSCSSNKSEENTKENPEITVNETEVATETAPVHGVGPVETVTLTEEIDAELAAKGEAIFQSKCLACHNFEQRLIGPALNGVTERRNPAWIINMILNPVEMTQKDPIAKALLEEYGSQMVNMNVTEEDARAILEYFRLKNSQG